MRLPADQAGERRGDRLIGDEIAREGYRRSRDEHHRCHAEEPWPAVGDEPLGRGFGHERNDAADEPRHRAVAQRNQQFNHEQGGKQPFGLAGEMPEERDQPGRRLRVLRGLGRPQQSFEQGKHESGAS